MPAIKDTKKPKMPLPYWAIFIGATLVSIISFRLTVNMGRGEIRNAVRELESGVRGAEDALYTRLQQLEGSSVGAYRTIYETEAGLEAKKIKIDEMEASIPVGTIIKSGISYESMRPVGKYKEVVNRRKALERDYQKLAAQKRALARERAAQSSDPEVLRLMQTREELLEEISPLEKSEKAWFWSGWWFVEGALTIIMIVSLLAAIMTFAQAMGDVLDAIARFFKS